MPPGVRLGWTQPQVQAGQGVQGGGLLRDEEKPPWVFPLGPAALGAAAHLPLAAWAVPGLVQRLTRRLSRAKRRQHTQTLLGGPSSRGEEIAWSVL